MVKRILSEYGRNGPGFPLADALLWHTVDVGAMVKGIDKAVDQMPKG